MADIGKPTVLVVAPMPVAPTSAGNRRRLLATCEALQRGGFAIDLAYLEHEDQIYRRFGQQPPTDAAAMAAGFQRTFFIPAATPIPLKTWATSFSIDAWCPDEAVQFVEWYFAEYPGTCAIIVNYVFLSRCLDVVPAGVQRIVDTHDRFADRQLQYRPFRSEPNFFYTDRVSEATGASRADVVLAIQATEAAYFKELVDRDVRLLPPLFAAIKPFRAPKRLVTFGFIGHGNDPNLFSISKFVHAWAAVWQHDRPILVIAGEICRSLGELDLPGVTLAGYVADLEAFYESVDAVVAPMLMGSGLKMKVAEALSMGRPVVGTRIAFEGFDVTHPAHRLDGVADTAAAILKLRNDSAGLAQLTTACADLFSRYNTAAAAYEAEWLETIPRRASSSIPLGAAAEPRMLRRADLGSVVLSEERSLRSMPLHDQESGVLVATERLSPAAARAVGYSAERRRWFAKVTSAAMTPVDLQPPPPDMNGVPISLAPEWVRERTLPQRAREALAVFFGHAQADWATNARVIGMGPDGITVIGCVPSFLLTGTRTTAAFVLGGAGQAWEARVIRITALTRSPDLAFTTQRCDLTPVPAALTISSNGASTSAVTGSTPSTVASLSDPESILLLSDDLIGRLILPSSSADTLTGTNE